MTTCSILIEHRKIIENYFELPKDLSLKDSIYLTESDYDPNIESMPMPDLKVVFSQNAFFNFEQTFGSQNDEEADQLHTWEMIGKEEFNFEIQLLTIEYQ